MPRPRPWPRTWSGGSGASRSRRDPRVAERAWRWCRRNPVDAGLGGLVLILSAGVLTGLVVSNHMIWMEQARTVRQLYINRVNLVYREAAADNFALAERL